MKNIKKIIVAIMGIALAFGLAACSKTVATTSGGKITQNEYYNQMKSTQMGKQVLQQLILNKVLEHQYGDKVSNKEVTEQYNKYRDQYGSQFAEILAQNNLTPSTFKNQIRSNLLLKQAVIDNVKITNKMREEQWKNYQPKITVAHIVTSNKNDAQNVINELNKDGSFSNFAKLAKKYSIENATKNNGGKLPPFDNTNQELNPEFKHAAFKLKENQFTKNPVKVGNTYQIIYCIKNPGKGNMKNHIKQLDEQIIDSDMSNPEILHDVIAKVLKKGHVSIKDKDLQNILSNYVSSSNPKSIN